MGTALMLYRFGFKGKWVKALDVSLIVFASIGIIQIAIWFADRDIPVEVHKRTLVNLSVPPGGEFRYLNYFTRRQFAETRVRRWIVDSKGVMHMISTLDTSMATTGLNVPQIGEAVIPVPLDMPAGVAYSCFQVTWRANPVHRHLWPIVGPQTCLSFIVNRDIFTLRIKVEFSAGTIVLSDVY